MATVGYNNVTRIYPGATKPSVSNLDLQISDGEFLVLVGPSGCGKSTSLRMLAGLEDVNSGTISIGDRDVTHMAPKNRDIAMVFQNYALYPHMTVRQNMGFALKIAGMPKAEINNRVNDAAEILDLTRFLDRKPKAMSGGERQRVAMGRAIVRNPAVFLMDEPLSNLDAKLRVQTRGEISALQKRLGVTTVYVTHDQTEAMTMGHRVAVLKDGILRQVGTPQALFDHPVDVFVAGFIGSPAMNLIKVPLTADGTVLGASAITLPADAMQAARASGAATVQLGFRPEDVELTGESEGFRADVFMTERLGADAYVHAAVQVGDATADIAFRADGRHPPLEGDAVYLRIAENRAHVFDSETALRLGD